MRQDLEAVGDFVSGKEMTEWLVELAVLFLQEVCEEKALSFLDGVFKRVTDKVDVCDEDRKIPYVMQVCLSQVEDSTFLFQESKVYPAEMQSSIYEYRLCSQVIQCGACVETVICNRFNGVDPHCIQDVVIEYSEESEMDFGLWVDRDFSARLVNHGVVMSSLLDRP